MILASAAELADSVLAVAPPSVAALQPDIAGRAPTTALHDIREQISRLADTVAAMQARSTPEERQRPAAQQSSVAILPVIPDGITGSQIEGFVDLGDRTPADQKNVVADHSMVVLFQPITGNWTQILGVFASKSNVKSATLAKIIVETAILAEKAGLFVDCIT
ncbi:hypothetical protein HPB50_022033 [Hyalomma asiaticum]|uniref:Uncharacterized protein n=1 Tax=Hyalomma asiaticum TaxID=266040 RepID=A0ACB7T167_HYAAI|nr:hypothetical protein HPB50_022033 [Hyalomma asiaticum]